jgi:tagatose-6-phosphate ketose/aldose isomerase
MKLAENKQTILCDFYTENEIARQPTLWKKIFNEFLQTKANLKSFLNNFINNKDLRVILTGAGSSAFIGDVILGVYKNRFKSYVDAVPTTDLVTHPELFFNKQNKYLLISFARSGNSPESSQAIVLAEELSHSVSHLIITCNEKSELISTASSRDKYIYLLPQEANDKGLAMTASFTSMLLVGLLISRINNDDQLDSQINILSEYGSKILETYKDDLKKAASLYFKRAVFLGSGFLKGIARESHLKLQELTDGKVICKYDSFMGFRHGPKAVIDEDTLIVYLFSNNHYANLYEKDLVATIAESRKNLFSIGIMEENIDSVNADIKIVLSENGRRLQEDFLTVVSVLPAQMLGLYKSINLGLNPDNPSESGMIHRVVQGVNIYPYPNGK